ncbi:MAG: zinc ribbon domain-containing protein [Chloroflexales bacterium]
MKCPSCASNLPDDARFCIDCGVILDTAATGPTVHLRTDKRSSTACAACGTSNPGHAIFCVHCGQRMSNAAPRPAPPRHAIGNVSQRVPSLPTHKPQQTLIPGLQISKNVSGIGIVMIGLGLISLGHFFWPGILILIGVVNFFRMSSSGHSLQGVRNILWFFGIALIFLEPFLFLPCLFILIGMNAIISEMIRSGQRWPRA